MNEDIKVSVIVPVYNTKEELNRCIESLINQTYSNLEIILVDDGSNDGSAAICDEYVLKDGRISVIHQTNAGVVAARKTGLNRANGEYISFVDSDDYIDLNTYEELTKIASSTRVDIVTFGCTREYAVNENLKVPSAPEFDSFEMGIYNKINREYFFENLICFKGYSQIGISPSLWSKLIRRSLLENNIKRVPETITYGEDACLIYMCCMDADKVYVLHKSFYHYCMRETSCIHSSDKKCFLVLNESYECLEKKALEMRDYKEVLLKQVEKYIARMAIFCLKNRFGFSNGGVLPSYTIRLNNFSADTKLVLYGAGSVGTSYYKQIKGLGQANIVLWVDKDPKQVEKNDMVSPVEDLLNTEYDYILIGVKQKSVAAVIKEDLKKMGIPEEKMMWEEPQFILDIYN